MLCGPNLRKLYRVDTVGQFENEINNRNIKQFSHILTKQRLCDAW